MAVTIESFWGGVKGDLMNTIMADGFVPAPVPEPTVEYIGPDQVPVALECAYCGKVIVVDLLRWNGECFRCGGSATIDEIATALALLPSAPPFADQFVVNSGTMAYSMTEGG